MTYPLFFLYFLVILAVLLQAEVNDLCFHRSKRSDIYLILLLHSHQNLAILPYYLPS